MTSQPPPRLRPARAPDQPGVIRLIDSVYREYGDLLCLEGADRDLLELSATYGDDFVVLEQQGEIVGTHAVRRIAERPGVCTFRRLYLAAPWRGTGWGERLMDWAVGRARELGCRRIEFWSDTKFERAHRFFRRLGFRQDGRRREMHDANLPYSEWFFYQDLVAPTESPSPRP